MDNNTLIALIIIAAVILVGFLLYRRSVKAKIIAGPVSAEFEGSNAPDQPAATTAQTPSPAPGIIVKDAKSTGGGLSVDEKAGGPVDVERVETKKDISVTRSDDTPAPKA